MKKQSKLSILITLSLVTLIATIGLANAQPQPIGTTLQPNPYESNPANVIDNTLFGIVNPAGMRDGRLTTEGYFQLADWDADTDVILDTFDVPATTFTIGWVDLKVCYSVDILWDDTWRIEYQVAPDTSWIVVQPDTTGQFDSSATPSSQTCVWSQISEPNDGVWDWADIAGVKVRFYTTPGPDTVSDFMLLHVVEVWLTVNAPPLPLAGGGGGGGATGISVQPTNVASFGALASRRFFVDIYAQGATALAAFQITIDYDTTYLNALAGGWTYYPFIPDFYVIDDAAGYVSITGGIPISDPLVGTGVSGNFPIARIYFMTTTGISASWYSWLTFSVSLLSDPTAARILHMEYDGLYGTAPPETFLFSWVPMSDFDPLAPITTEWIEVYPDPGNRYHLSSWADNGNDVLDASDQIDMTPIDPPGDQRDFHVDKIWEVDADPNIGAHMVVARKPPIPEFPLGIGILMAIAPMIAIVYVWRLRKRSK